MTPLSSFQTFVSDDASSEVCSCEKAAAARHVAAVVEVADFLMRLSAATDERQRNEGIKKEALFQRQKQRSEGPFSLLQYENNDARRCREEAGTLWWKAKLIHLYITVVHAGPSLVTVHSLKYKMANFTNIFGIAVTICMIVTFFSSDFYKHTFQKNSTQEEEIPQDVKDRHTKLLRRYLFVYLLATLSDWLQGPYVYALYMEYGFEQHQIAELFVAGFGSSMIFGSFVGGMADGGGRRTFVLLFTAVFGASCFTKREFCSHPFFVFEGQQ